MGAAADVAPSPRAVTEDRYTHRNPLGKEDTPAGDERKGGGRPGSLPRVPRSLLRHPLEHLARTNNANAMREAMGRMSFDADAPTSTPSGILNRTFAEGAAMV